MKNTIISIFAAIMLSACGQSADPASGHYLDFENPEALHSFFGAGSDAVVIVQGHRGTRENGLPESSIEAMEWVLSQTSAIFEIDPRLTRDSVVVVLHDPTLDRTTDGTGLVADHTWEELQELYLKNAAGELTHYKIPSLVEVLEWARGKTALILDKKDVPPGMIADMIREHTAAGYVLNMVRSTEEARFYYDRDPRRMLAASIHSPEDLRAYLDAGIPPSQMFACLGTRVDSLTTQLCELVNASGMRSLMATATSYDKLKTPEERAREYRAIVESGITMIESNYPVEVASAISK